MCVKTVHEFCYITNLELGLQQFRLTMRPRSSSTLLLNFQLTVDVHRWFISHKLKIRTTPEGSACGVIFQVQLSTGLIYGSLVASEQFHE